MARILSNGVVCPDQPKERDPFRAGWDAAMERVHHDWGPAPPDNPAAARRVWEGTCDEGHTSRLAKCPACERMARKGGSK
jgi:hypothetical protein